MKKVRGMESPYPFDKMSFWCISSAPPCQNSASGQFNKSVAARFRRGKPPGLSHPRGPGAFAGSGQGQRVWVEALHLKLTAGEYLSVARDDPTADGVRSGWLKRRLWVWSILSPATGPSYGEPELR